MSDYGGATAAYTFDTIYNFFVETVKYCQHPNFRDTTWRWLGGKASTRITATQVGGIAYTVHSYPNKRFSSVLNIGY